MQVIYNGAIQILRDAVERANELLTGDRLYKEIAKKQGFDFTSATGNQIADSIKKCRLTLKVLTFKKYFTKELGYEDPHDPTSIHINIVAGKLNRSLGSITGTFIHEAVHAADADDEFLSFPHHGNKAAGNENTAPYWIGNLAVQLVDRPSDPVDIHNLVTVAHAPQDTIENNE